MSANCGAKQARVVLDSKNAGDVELDRYAGTVYWLARYITEDNEDADEVLQLTFLRADSDSAKFRQNESSVVWLLEIAVSESFAKLRIRDAAKLLRLSLEAGAEVAFVPQEIVDWDDDAEKRYTSEKWRRIVNEAIQSLTPFSRIVFLLRDVAELRTEEIADLFHLSVASVKSHSLRSRLQLRENFSKYFKSKLKETAQTA